MIASSLQIFASSSLLSGYELGVGLELGLFRLGPYVGAADVGPTVSV